MHALLYTELSCRRAGPALPSHGSRPWVCTHAPTLPLSPSRSLGFLTSAYFSSLVQLLVFNERSPPAGFSLCDRAGHSSLAK